MTMSTARDTSVLSGPVAVSVPSLYQGGVTLYVSILLFSIPLVCFAGALLSDAAYVRDPNIQWSNFASWLLAFGILSLGLAIFASVIGLLISFGRKRGPAHWLFGLFVLVAAVTALFDNFVHSHDGWTSVWPAGLMLSATTFSLLAIGMLFRVFSLSKTFVVEAS
jgi:uncharacterized membrane protein